MGLLAADLERHRMEIKTSSRPGRTMEKTASVPANPVESLRVALELYAGAEKALEKSAGETDHARLYRIHRTVEEEYRKVAQVGRRPEADAILDRFPGWTYLKGQPPEPGDWTPLPAPEEK